MSPYGVTMAGRLDQPACNQPPEPQAVEPIVLTPKTERPEHLVQATGSIDLANIFASGSSGGRI